jgi:polysaccharide export outer membrane protein
MLEASTAALPNHQAKPLKVTQYKVGKDGELQNNSSSMEKVDSREAYRLRAGDKVRFELLNESPKIETQHEIDNLGSINLEYINWVEIVGKTLKEANEHISKLYAKDYFVNPKVKLRLVEKAPLRYKILGQVANPGFYEVPPGLEVDLLDAIAIAGGYTRIAGRITFKAPLPDGGDEVKTFKMKELTSKSTSRIPQLKGDETIIVGESFF